VYTELSAFIYQVPLNILFDRFQMKANTTLLQALCHDVHLFSLYSCCGFPFQDELLKEATSNERKASCFNDMGLKYFPVVLGPVFPQQINLPLI